MLKITNTVVTKEDTATITEHTVEGSAVLAQDSCWEYDYDTHGDTVRVSKIVVIEDEEYDMTTVNVVHEAGWRIYTDSGFEQAISEVLGFDVMFTEQGMQDNNCASMEV